jgi:hypothetical protein
MGWSYQDLLATDDEVVAAVVRLIEKDKPDGNYSR